MNQENDYDVNHMKNRYLHGVDAEVRLKEGIQKVEVDLKEDIQKVEVDLKEDIQKVEANFMKAIQEVKENHRQLVTRILWGVGLVFAGVISIVAALISKGN